MFSRLDYVKRYFFSANFWKLRTMNVGFETRKKSITDIIHNVFLTEIVYFLQSDKYQESSSVKACILTAAVSTPVGPPPHITKLRRRFLSSGDVVGRLASSKLSKRRHELKQEARRHKVIPIMRRRIDCASPIVFNCRQFSKPGTPWVLEEEPTAMTILSYLSDVSKLQM